MLKIEVMEAAARGAVLMFFCYPVKEGLLEATTIAALAAHSAGMRGIVNLSQWCAKLDSHSPYSRKHSLSEAVRTPWPSPALTVPVSLYIPCMMFYAPGVLAHQMCKHQYHVLPGCACGHLAPSTALQPMKWMLPHLVHHSAVACMRRCSIASRPPSSTCSRPSSTVGPLSSCPYASHKGHSCFLQGCSAHDARCP